MNCLVVSMHAPSTLLLSNKSVHSKFCRRTSIRTDLEATSPKMMRLELVRATWFVFENPLGYFMNLDEAFVCLLTVE